MKQSEQEMKEWAQQLNAVHLPRWEELPDIDLYMDQVMTLMDRYLDLLLGRSQRKNTGSGGMNFFKIKRIQSVISIQV